VPGRYDAVIGVSDGSSRSGIVTHRLLPIATVPVCAPSWLEDGKVDFAAIPLLHARPRPEDWRRWLDHAGFGAVSGLAGSSFESLGLAMEAAAAGLGCAIAIDGLLPKNLTASNLARAHHRVRPTRRYFVLQYETRLTDDPAMTLFKDWLIGLTASS
jgi:LysR family glycine cleavage system transcriptional activator